MLSRQAKVVLATATVGGPVAPADETKVVDHEASCVVDIACRDARVGSAQELAAQLLGRVKTLEVLCDALANIVRNRTMSREAVCYRKVRALKEGELPRGADFTYPWFQGGQGKFVNNRGVLGFEIGEEFIAASTQIVTVRVAGRSDESILDLSSTCIAFLCETGFEAVIAPYEGSLATVPIHANSAIDVTVEGGNDLCFKACDGVTMIDSTRNFIISVGAKLNGSLADDLAAPAQAFLCNVYLCGVVNLMVKFAV